MARLFIILFTLAIISQVITDKGSPLILQEEPKAKDILELDEDITEFDNAQNDNESEKSISESSVDSSADLNKSSAKSNTNSNKDSQKEILEMYFSYGKEMIKLEGDNSRHSNDMNLHIVTSGYNDDEQMEIEVRTQDESFIINATMRDNQALLKNVFNGKNIPIGEIEIYA